MNDSHDSKHGAVKSRSDESTKIDEFVLVAAGVADRCTVLINESLIDSEQLSMQIKSDRIYLSFGIMLEKVAPILQFLAPQYGNTANGIPAAAPKPGDSISIGKNNRFPVRLICDSEEADRFVFMIGTAKSSLVRYTVQDDDLAQLIDAMQQVRDELARDGLL